MINPRFNAKYMRKLFNLGLHLNNEQNMLVSHQKKYGRMKSLGTRDSAMISNPIWMTYQFIQFLQIFRRLLENNEKIIVINTEPVYGGYIEFFEGSNINYYEEGWPPGTITNPETENGEPIDKITLVLLISARVEDRKVILSEIKRQDLPVINLSPYFVEKTLFSAGVLPNRNFLHFYLQLIRYLLINHQKKNWSLVSSSGFSDNLINQLDSKDGKNTEDFEDNECLHQTHQMFSELKNQKNSTKSEAPKSF